MARDLDFLPRRRSVATSSPSSPTKPLAVAPIVSNKKGPNGFLWVVIVVLLIAAAIGIWQFIVLSAPTVSNIKTPAPIKQAPVTTAPTPDTQNSILSPQTISPTVQIYDSGAGTYAVDSLVSKLTTLGYKVDNLNMSQFNYDRTYIRYRAGMQQEAEKIQLLMPERLVSLKEVQSASLFDILILYGVK